MKRRHANRHPWCDGAARRRVAASVGAGLNQRHAGAGLQRTAALFSLLLLAGALILPGCGDRRPEYDRAWQVSAPMALDQRLYYIDRGAAEVVAVAPAELGPKPELSRIPVCSPAERVATGARCV